jgi:hypothetical protein
VEAEINILLKFLELLLEPAILELHLFELAGDLPHLAFKAPNPDEELRAIGRLSGESGIARLPNISRRPPIALRNGDLHPAKD